MTEVLTSSLKLARVQIESGYYGLKLNLDKCINITMNIFQSEVRFMNGDIMPRKSKATYLGAILTDENSNREELLSRIASCNHTANRLKLCSLSGDIHMLCEPMHGQLLV